MLTLKGAANAAALLACLLVGLAGCGNGGGGKTDGGSDGDQYPDPAFVHRVEARVETGTDESFLQERPTLYRTEDALPQLDVTCLAAVGTEVLAGTADALYRFDPVADAFTAVPFSAIPSAPVIDIARRPMNDGRILYAMADRLIIYTPGGGPETQTSSPGQGDVTAIATDGANIWLAIGTDLFLYPANGPVEDLNVPVPGPITDLAWDGTRLWLATSDGLVSLEEQNSTTHTAASGALPDDDVRALAALPSGGVVAACATGAAVVGSEDDRILEVGLGQLPTGELTSAAAGENGIFLGHAIGATYVAGHFAHKDYYHSLRWIPAERVTAVALTENRRWIATDGGIARIDLAPTTLAEKADLMESFNDDFWRLDFVSDDGSRAEPWDTSASIHHHDHDNDGLWTQMQIVAWSYAGAASGDPVYCERARRAMGAMLWQIDIPAVTFEAAGLQRGFVTRSFVRDDEGEVFTSKAVQDNWHLVQGWEDGHDYYWKDDTSSDETTGHFFGYPVYYDLCADEAEKAVLAEHAGALARYIVDNEYLLIDLDGEKTTHGHWSPDRLAICVDGLTACMEEDSLEACAEACYGGGWLNGIEILGHLLAAWHMTGDPFFYDAYDALISEHRYDELVDFHDDTMTVTSRAIANHSDHELAMLAYHTLIRYEPNEERRARWIQSLLDMYEHEILERNPCWAAIVAMAAPEGYHLDEAIQTLQEWPEDWREWRYDNSHRKDYAVDPSNDRSGDPQFTTVPPYDEIRTLKWNTNPYQITGGGDGRSVQAPWPWLLPYWMLRYHGVLE